MVGRRRGNRRCRAALSSLISTLDRAPTVTLAGFPTDVFSSPTATTPSADLHIYCCTNVRSLRNAVRIAGAAIDIRTPGGYSILHSVGNARRWFQGKPYDFAPIPDGLAAALATQPAPGAPVLLTDTPSSPPLFAYRGPASRYGAATARKPHTSTAGSSSTATRNLHAPKNVYPP
jgi:hypothetical protein